jgi:hypothetical protein
MKDSDRAAHSRNRSLNGRILKQYESKQMDRLCSISCERFVMAGYLHRL